MAASGKMTLKWSVFLSILVFSNAQLPLYSEDGSTQLTQSTQQVNLPSGVTFPFFGKIYNALYVSKDGLVGFSPQAAYKNTVYSKYQTQYVASNDYPFAAAFHFAAVSHGSVTSAGETYRGVTKYRQILSANEESRNISNFIRAAFPGQDQFQATYVLVVTWRDVFDLREQSVVNCQYQTGPNICKTNTFQQVMVTDGSSSFAIFNYLKTDVKTSPTTQSGFNGGNGRGWSEAIKSGSLQTANASQGSDVVGRYVYQIEDTVIYKGGCTPQKSNMETLYIKQQYAGMFGGKMIDFNGPCLATNRKIKCKFGHDAGEKTSTGIMVNSMRGRCLVPTLLERGRVPVALSINDGFSYYFSSELTIVHPSRMPSMLSYGKGWNETTSTSLSMSWQSDDLTNVSSALVDVTLIGYKETLVRSSWDILLTISQGIRVSQGSFTFNVKDALCNDDCSSYEIGIVQIKLQDMSLATSHGFLVSGILPLGFLMNTRMTEKYGAKWPHDKCLAWYNKDSEDTSWLTAIPNCPCNLQQALVDIGSWQADLGCNLFSNRDGNCRFHHEAVHCVRAVQPAMHNKDGAGNQCCYARNGLLLFAADTFQGSTPDRSHDWGASPYVQPNYVPSTSHWLHDVITFYYCCLWVEYKDCDYYMDNRATRDCKNYMPPKQAMVYGLSHVMTFDGSSYRVCGEGDFVLLKSLEMTIEGRFQKSKFLTGTQNKSVILTDVGIKFNTEKVEIRLRGPDVDRSQRLIDVLVSDKFILFDQTPMRWQDFKECAIVNNMDLNNPSSNMESNFTVISHDGIGIQVAVKNDMLELMVVLPPKLKNKVLGLLGDWNGNRSDDFKPNETSSSVQFTDLPTLFSDFQYAWAIKEKKNSIVPFTLLAVNDSSMCNVPMSGTGYGFCGGNKECEFDMWETNNRTLALATKLSSERYTEIDSFSQPVRSCGLLDVPRSRKSSNNYTLGSKVTVTDCRVGTLSGDTTYTCTANGEEKQQWSPTVTASCADTLEDAQTTLIVAIVVPVVVVFVIIVIIIAVIMKRRSGKNERAANKNVNPEEKESRRNDPPNPINTKPYSYAEVARREDPIVKGGKTASV